MRCLVVLAVILCLVEFGQGAPAWAKDPPPAGVVVNGTVVKPGDLVLQVWGAAGPPDTVHAIRGEDKTKDYIYFRYQGYGFGVDVSNVNNEIVGILVQNSQVKCQGVPIRVTENAARIRSAWGAPDQEIKDTWCYFKRGVYITRDAGGLVSSIYITTPGKDEPPPPPPPTRKQPS